jgi:MoaA/NifB/PqqE/SkfB family radical SAM enzyme
MEFGWLDREQTDSRRSRGTYDILLNAMEKLKTRGILFGVSVTVTIENIDTVTSKTFFQQLYQKGCRALIFVEYVPVTNATKELAPTERERQILEGEQEKLRSEYEDVIFLSFPGDEKYMGGCIAAGRGFFHINSKGGAEPCPFSPFSDINLSNCTLLESVQSPLFRKIREAELLLGEHNGGCVLFEKEAEIRKLLHLNIEKTDTDVI